MKELYLNNTTGNNYSHNIKVLASLKNEKNIELEKLLNTKYVDLYDEYIKSDVFKINDINKLKKKNMSDSYIMRYIYFSKHFIEFYQK